MELSEQETKAYDKALRLLSMRMHSMSELTKKLERKGFGKEAVAKIIVQLREQDLLNDERAASSYLDSLIAYKTFGYYGIKAKMIQKGFSQELIEDLLASRLDLGVEESIAKKFLEKKPRTKVSAAQALSRKGFRSQIIGKLLPGLSD